jgi:hypothetical protein
MSRMLKRETMLFSIGSQQMMILLLPEEVAAGLPYGKK